MKRTQEEIREQSETYQFNLYKRYPLVLKKGRGARVWDEEGNEYIDALAGIGVNNVGHCHPKVVEAVQKQAGELIHVSNLYYTDEQARLGEELVRMSGMEKVFFSNSGAEAMEAAVKMARKYATKTGKTGPVISLENAFHGRTIGTISLGREKYRKGFGPLPERIVNTPVNDIKALEAAIDDQTVALIIEPIQGEGGVVPVDKVFLQKARELCDRHGVLLIFDEVQCGIARTGKMFAWMHYDVQPDILATAKGLGGGVPIGATMASKKAAALLDYGEHGTTFGGNSLASAAALAVLEVIEEEDLCGQAEEKGAWLMSELRKRTEGWDCVKTIRGIGMMIGMELTFKGAPVVEKMLEKGVLSNCANDYVMRLLPPLVITREEMEKVLDALLTSVKECEPVSG
ncbi:MAG: aspartate aminotransferase family protein [Balneolaceae bacterium]